MTKDNHISALVFYLSYTVYQDKLGSCGGTKNKKVLGSSPFPQKGLARLVSNEKSHLIPGRAPAGLGTESQRRRRKGGEQVIKAIQRPVYNSPIKNELFAAPPQMSKRRSR